MTEVAQDSVIETTTPAIRVRHLWHSFGVGTVLRDVSFDVPQGEIFGFIGPNGAGKTTTIRVMATLLEPTAGRVEIEGIDVVVDPDEVRRIVGYMADHCGVYERITVREYLEFFAAAAGVQAAVVAAVIELTDLGNVENQLVASLSKGMRQRLQLARVLLHDPKVLIMDEPASDLDPRARIEIKDLLLELRELGKTIFLSSHILSELSDVCTSIGIIERGELLVAGPIGQIAEQLAERKDAARISERPAAESSRDRQPASVRPAPAEVHRRVKIRVLADSNAVAPLLPRSASVLSVEPSPGGWLLVNYAGDETVVAEIVRALVGQGVAIVAVEPERNELERIFLEVTRGSLQ